MNNVDSPNKPYQVVCVCGGHGFPLGTGSGARITMVGKALREAGISFRLLHCGPSPVSINTQRSGIYDGIPFEYTTPVKRPNNRLIRLLMYAGGILGLTVRLIRLWPERAQHVVYLYVMMGPLNLYTGLLCRMLGIPVVQELCEWWPCEPSCSAFTRWLHKKPMFKLATGTLVISRAIQARATERAAEVNPFLGIHRLPSIVDTRRFAAASPLVDDARPGVPNFVYCGTWHHDVYFLVRALARVRRAGYMCKLTIVGNYGPDKDQISKHALENGLSMEDVVFTGCVDERTLEASYKGAVALLMPLWDDDQSVTRLPNKMGEYLGSGRPVIGSRIGDLTEFLFDGINAYLGEPGNEDDFVERMIAVLQDPERATQIGAAGQAAGIAYLDYRSHIDGLARFFTGCIEQYRTLHSPRPSRGGVKRPYMMLRNVTCEFLALLIILSGRVRKARKRALGGGVVTSIYFHKPNRRLFERCVRWLMKHGYTFISTKDLIEILAGAKIPPPGAVWLSFDDGNKELLYDVLPLVRTCRIPVTLFIPSGIIEGNGLYPWIRREAATAGRFEARSFASAARHALTVDELQQLIQCEHITIGSHTVNHALTTCMIEQKADVEFGQSKHTLESWAGTSVTSFAYPEGRYDGGERPFLTRFGYMLAATTENSFVTPGSDPYRVPRFSIGNDISFPEAICNMVGVWRPLLDSVKSFFSRVRESGERLTKFSRRNICTTAASQRDLQITDK